MLILVVYTLFKGDKGTLLKRANLILVQYRKYILQRQLLSVEGLYV